MTGKRRTTSPRRPARRGEPGARLARAEASLRTNELQLRQILDNTVAALVFAKDLDGRYLFVNRAFERLAGLERREIVGRLTDEIFPPEVAARLRANDRQVLEAGRALEFEEPVGIGGETRTLLTSKFPLLDEAGRPYAICGIAADITERKRSEQALRRAALAVSAASGPQVFETLVLQLADILGVGAAMISVFVDARRTRMRTLATCLDAQVLRPFEYDLAASPCAGVIGRDFRFVASGVRPEFKPGTMFAEKGFDAYAAYSLADASGVQLGLMVVMDRRPLANRELTEAMLKIFAVRAAAELERGRAEEALRASEASYRSIFEANEDAMFVHEWDTGRVLDVSPKASDLFGYAPAEMRRLTVAEMSANEPPYTQAEADRWIQKAKVTDGPLRFEWRARHKDGRLMWHEVTLKRATIAGEPRVLAFVRDVTARKAADEALRSSEEQYRAIFNASDDALVLWDSALRRVDVNPAYERLFGFTREEVLVHGYADRRPAAYLEPRRELVRRTLAGVPCEAELESVRKDGERIQIEVRTLPVRHRGEPHVLAICRDVTERRRAEAAVRASEEQYRTIFNASVDGLLLWDAEHRVVDANEAFLSMHGYRREEVVGHTRPVFIPPALAQQCATLLPEILAGTPCHIEARTQRSDGTEFDVAIHGIPMQYQGRPHVLIIVRDVTDAKRAEARLRASEERYRLLFEMESDAIVLVDAETLRLIDANRAAEQLWGHSRAELLALAVTDLSVEPERTRTSVQSPGGRVHIPLRMHRKRDGTVFPVEITANRLVLDGRTIVVAAVRDITERRRAEEALRASEEQYRAIFNASADALALRDADFRLVDVNPAMLALTGLAREEVLGSTRMLFTPPEHQAAARGLFERELGGEATQYETEAVRRDGTRFAVEVRGVPVQHRGQPHVLVVVRDITERKRAEEAIRASEAQYREIFNASADALVLRDADFRIVDVNATYEALSGFGREEVLGADRIVANPREVEAPIRALHARALAGETVRFETEFLRRDGPPRDVELRGVPITHRGAPHVLYLGRDITAQKHADAERRELEAQLRQAQKMEAIGHLTGGIAHDFNNILTSIMGYIALAGDRDAARDDAKLTGYLERAQASSERARDLIQQMLTFSRGKRGDPRPVNLAPLVRESAKLLRSTLPSSVELATDFASDVPRVLLDPVHADQVLLNLCINARDAMDGNGAVHVRLARTDLHGAVCASCRKRVAGAYVELAVRDTGPGIAPEVLERMFEPFFSTKEVGKGSGMGLATVHGIVHEHGGHVVVETAPGQGTTFRVLFPVLRTGPAGEAGPDARQAGRPARARLAGRVLVVDDEESVGEFMCELLESWGLDVTLAPGAAEAREAFARSPEGFDLVLTDQTMPRTTGVQLARELAAIRPDVPVVLYTGYADTRTENEARAAGVVALLRKPVDRAALLAALEAHLSTPGARGGS